MNVHFQTKQNNKDFNNQFFIEKHHMIFWYLFIQSFPKIRSKIKFREEQKKIIIQIIILLSINQGLVSE